jgi:hypothetical protein
MAKNIALDDDQTALHQEVLDNLIDARGKLLLIDPNSLDDDQEFEWHQQLSKVGDAILAAEGAILTSVSSAYAKKLPALKESTDKLERDLHKLKAANDVINTIGAALGTIANIATLLA